ncbi:MAG: hypothetical protein CME61_01035 [Halobacteriovoraceae bacterium]|nr:hypothetical protein [Halobacteriovoraceae bacterium]
MLKAIPLLIFIAQLTHASPTLKVNQLDGISLKSGEFFRTVNRKEFDKFIQKIKLSENETTMKLNAKEFERIYLMQGETIERFNTVSAATAGGDMGGGGKVITLEK